MKPVYEIVRADELRVGDVVQWSGTDCEILGKIQEDERGDILFQFFRAGAYFSKKVFYRIELSRQLPPERNPDVLMRALRIREPAGMKTPPARVSSIASCAKVAGVVMTAVWSLP